MTVFHLSTCRGTQITISVDLRGRFFVFEKKKMHAYTTTLFLKMINMQDMLEKKFTCNLNNSKDGNQWHFAAAALEGLVDLKDPTLLWSVASMNPQNGQPAGWGGSTKISINYPVDILTAWFKKGLGLGDQWKKKDRKRHIACVGFPVISSFSTNSRPHIDPPLCKREQKWAKKNGQTQEPHGVTENVSTPALRQAVSCQTKTVKLFEMSCSARFFPNHRQRAHRNVFFSSHVIKRF